MKIVAPRSRENKWRRRETLGSQVDSSLLRVKRCQRRVSIQYLYLRETVDLESLPTIHNTCLPYNPSRTGLTFTRLPSRLGGREQREPNPTCQFYTSYGFWDVPEPVQWRNVLRIDILTLLIISGGSHSKPNLLCNLPFPGRVLPTHFASTDRVKGMSLRCLFLLCDLSPTDPG